MNILFIKHFCVGFMIYEIKRVSVLGHCLYSVTFPCLYILYIIYALIQLIYNSSVRIIKATCVNLSLISLMGVALSYVSSLFMVIPPTVFTCYVANILMNIGICMTFGVLLLVR